MGRSSAPWVGNSSGFKLRRVKTAADSLFWGKSRQTYFLFLPKQTSGALNMKMHRHYCHSGCLSCKHKLNALPPPPITGYHPECHTPTIEPEADSDSWICRQCVFAVATKVRLLISPSRTGVGWGRRNNIQHVIWQEIQSNTSGFAATTVLCTAGNGFMWGKSTLIPSLLTSVLDVLHCVQEIMNNQ